MCQGEHRKINQYIDFSKCVRYLSAPNNSVSCDILAAGKQCSAHLSFHTPGNSTKTTCSKRLLTFHESGSKLTKLSQYLSTDSTEISLESQETEIKQFS